MKHLQHKGRWSTTLKTFLRFSSKKELRQKMTFFTDTKCCWASDCSFVFSTKQRTAGQHLPTHEVSQIYTGYTLPLNFVCMSVQSFNVKFCLLNQCVSTHTHAQIFLVTFLCVSLPSGSPVTSLASRPVCWHETLVTKGRGGARWVCMGKECHTHTAHTQNTPRPDAHQQHWPQQQTAKQGKNAWPQICTEHLCACRCVGGQVKPFELVFTVKSEAPCSCGCR